MDKPRLLSASKFVRTGVGAFGQIYVWGDNSTNGLGIDDIDRLTEPTFVDLKHNYYSVKAKEVSCGESFYAVLGQDRSTPRVIMHEELKDNKPFFKYLFMLREYCEDRHKTLIQIYKSLKLKELSFFSITMNEIVMRFPNIQLNREELEDITVFLKMKVAGRRISILPLYEHLEAYCTWSKDSQIPRSLQQLSASIPRVVVEKPKRSERMVEELETLAAEETEFMKMSKIKDGSGLVFLFGNFKTKGGEVYELNDLTYEVVSLKSSECFTTIACGLDFVVAATNMHRVYTWANSQDSPIISEANSDKFNTPHLVPLGSWSQDKASSHTILDVAAGLGHIVILAVKLQNIDTPNPKTSTIIYTWGGNACSCLGIGHGEAKREPVLIQSIREDKIIGIAAGYNHTIAILEDNTVKAWGRVPETAPEPQDTKMPKLFSCYTEVKEVACGEVYNLVLNTKNQLIRVGGGPSLNYTAEDDHLNDPLFMQVAASDNVFMALTSDGTIYLWTPEFQSTEDSKLPEELDTSNVELIIGDRPREIEGYDNQFAILENAEAKKVRGDDAKNSRKIKKIAATSLCSFAMTVDGQVHATGSGVYGMLGTSSGDSAEDVVSSVDNFIPIPRISGNSKTRVIDIACGNYHVMAITTENKLIGWGRNDSGQLGLGNLQPHFKMPMFYEIDENLTITQADGTKVLVHNEDEIATIKNIKGLNFKQV